MYTSILLRTCLNVSTDHEGNMIDSTRYDESLPGIQALAKTAHRLLITAHLGRPKQAESQYSFAHIAHRLEQDLQQPVHFLSTLDELAASVGQSGVFFLENVRFFEGEESKDKEERMLFARQLAAGCDLFVNDAFADYRASASTYDVATLLPSQLGPLFQKEITELNKIKEHAAHPFIVVLGGSKLSEKLDVLLKLLPKADKVLIGGAMAYTLLKAQNISIGKSLFEEDKLEIARQMIAEYGSKIFLPIDHTVVERFEDPALGTTEIIENLSQSISDYMIAVDIGPKTRKIYSTILKKAKTIMRNGPMGVTERADSRIGTEHIGNIIAQQDQAYKLVGGGDSITAINNLGLQGFDHICTGGGAMLSYLGDDNFPTLDIIRSGSY